MCVCVTASTKDVWYVVFRLHRPFPFTICQLVIIAFTIGPLSLSLCVCLFSIPISHCFFSCLSIPFHSLYHISVTTNCLVFSPSPAPHSPLSFCRRFRLRLRRCTQSRSLVSFYLAIGRVSFRLLSVNFQFIFQCSFYFGFFILVGFFYSVYLSR